MCSNQLPYMNLKVFAHTTSEKSHGTDNIHKQHRKPQKEYRLETASNISSRFKNIKELF